MKFIADLHIHSRFSRATSKSLNPEQLHIWARKKGIAVIGTGDFTHPEWISELRDKLEEAEEGLYRLKSELRKEVDSHAPPSCPGPTRFLLSGEISCIYKKGGKTRKIHHLILMPDFASAEKFNERLDRIGNITSDGRPILGLDSRDLLEITLECSDRAFFVPAHVWTPWFSLFGSKSGFDSLEECFEDLSPHIHALETGLSSDPPMNRHLSALDDYVLVSNSDAHSPGKLGREANLFDTDLSYPLMIRAMTNGKGFRGTIEFFPEEGKYHLDGHRKCGIRLHPTETQALGEICPACERPLTVGVLHRVHELADRDKPKPSKDFFSLIPLTEILSELLDCGPSTKKVMSQYERLLVDIGPEIMILMETPIEEVETLGGPVLAEAIRRMRSSEVIREEGYDGQFGVIRLFHEEEKQRIAGQQALFAGQVEKRTRLAPLATPNLGRGRRRSKASRIPTRGEDPILAPLNPEQRTAVLYSEGHLIVKAGPGTGKTMTLAHRIAYLLREGLATPEGILGLTFTRKAAEEMGGRISTLLDGKVTPSILVTTFHGFCRDILRKKGSEIGLPSEFTLFSEWDVENLARQCMATTKSGERLLLRFIRALPRLKRTSVLEGEAALSHSELYPLFEEYQKRLRSMGMLDLDDLEVEALRLLRHSPQLAAEVGRGYPWIFVDEYQDTNPIQVALLKALIREDGTTLFAIGDPDQSIYGFRGAEVSHFYNFTKDFPGGKELILTRNYRSTEMILKEAAALMKKQDPLQGRGVEGVPLTLVPCTTESEEAEMIVEQVEKLIGGTSYFSLDSGRVASHEEEMSLGFGDIGVLFRLNAQGDALEEAISRAGIPYVRSGETPLVARFPVNLIWRFLLTLQYPENSFYREAYDQLLPHGSARVTNHSHSLDPSVPLTQLVEQTIHLHDLKSASGDDPENAKHLMELASAFEGNLEMFLDFLSLERGIDHAMLLGDRMALMSLHASKGLEWPVVFIIGCEDQLLPCSLFGERDEEEERRLFYVGMTRAHSRLFLSHTRRRYLGGRILTMHPSPFLTTMPEDLCRPLDRSGRKPKKRAPRQLDLF